MGKKSSFIKKTVLYSMLCGIKRKLIQIMIYRGVILTFLVISDKKSYKRNAA